jgi:hypothetical protein
VLRYASKNKSRPRVLTGKWLLKNYKLTTRLKNKIRTNPQIKNHEESWTQYDQITDTTQKTRTHTFQILNTTNTICGEKWESLGVQVSS